MATVLTVTDRFGRTKAFYDSDKHIVGDTRVKARCNPKDYIWQYLRKEDFDGIIMDRCVAIDVRELEDLERRGIKFYECHYTDGYWYRISLEDFRKWSHPVVTKFGSQLCVSRRHWRNNLDADENGMPPTSVKKARKPRKQITQVIPLRQSDLQSSMF